MSDVAGTSRGRACASLATVVAALVALLTLAPAAFADVTYSYEQTIPVPPASSYSGGGGGDGWALAMTPTAVYNVFHHSSQLQVACHLQSDASACWSPKTITDAAGNGFAVSGEPGLSLDQSNGHLYVYGTRSSDSTAGVVCIDTTKPAADPNPFCGYTTLTPPGDAPASASGVSNAMKIGSRLYGFNYVTGSGATGAMNKLLCFDTSTASACTGQPFAVAFGGGTVSVGSPPFHVPSVSSIGSRVIVPVNAGSDRLACFDGATQAACTGSWPISAPSGYSEGYGAAFPTLTAAGVPTGLCLPTPGIDCFDLSGASVGTPAGLTSAISAGSAWNSPAIAIGPRIYVPNGNLDVVQCFNFATGASCANFPKSLPGLGFLYSVNPDPQRADCIWVNADNGSGQIQNFNAFTGGACGQGPIRVIASSIVVPTETCLPTSYKSLAVLQPPRASYTSGNVQFLGGDGTPIPGLSDQPLDGAGAVSLVGMSLNTATGLPQFLITLNGASSTPASVVVKLVWTGVNDPSCVRPGTVVEGGSTHYRIDTKAWIPQPAVVDPEQPITLPFPIAAIIHRPCHTPSPFLIPFTRVSTQYHGDGHAGFDGSYRVMSSVEFDWDGHQILNASVPSEPHFGTTILRGTYTNFLNSNTCDLISRTATSATSFSAAGSSFSLSYKASNPAVRLPAPPIDGTTTGTVAADGAINFHFHTDIFPSHGVRVRKNGTPQLTDVVNDASCIPNPLALGLPGVALIGIGLTQQSNQGDRTVGPNDLNRTGRKNTPLCLGL